MSDPYAGVAVSDPYAGIAAPAQKPTTAVGVAKAAGSGLLTGLQSLTPQSAVSQGLQLGGDAAAWIAKHLGADPAKVDQAIQSYQAARAQVAPTATEIQQHAGLYHAPQNRAERWAETAGQMLPNAVFPEGAAAKAASVLLPTLGGEGAREVTEAAGGGPVAQGVAKTAGMLIGGGLSGVRSEALGPTVDTPTQIADVSPPVAQRAMAYVASRANNPDPAMQEAAAAGKPVLAAERLGTSGRTALGALARRPGATGDALAATLAERAADAPSRMQGDFETATGISPHAARGDLESYVAEGRVKASPLYDHAYAQTPPQNDALDNLMTRPSMHSALGRAANIAAEEGRDPNTLGFQFDPAGDVTHVETPSVQTLDYVKRGLDDVLGQYRDPMTKRLVLDERGRAIQATRNQFMDIMTSPNTEAGKAYGAAVGQAGDYLSASDAFTQGKNVFNPRVSTAQLQSTVAKMTPAQLGAFRGGVADHLFNLADNARLSPTDKFWQAPNLKAKLGAALGRDAAKQFLAGTAQEKLLAENGRRMAPGNGSPTAELNAEMAAQDAPSPLAQAGGEFLRDTAMGAAATFGNVPAAVKIAALRQAAKAAGGVTKTALAGAYGMSEDVRNAAGRLLMSPDINEEDVASWKDAGRKRLTYRPTSPLSITAINR